MKHPVPRVAAIHDLSGFGRASLTIVSPVLSTMGMQVCPLPTSLLSTHTSGFEGYTFLDLTLEMEKIINHWKKIGIEFDSIYSGFLGSPQQVDIVSRFIDDFSSRNQLVVVDPVIGDDGITYGPYGPDMIEAMKKLVRKAGIITPNYTESCFLLDRKYKTMVTEAEIKEHLFRLSEKGPGRVVITSVPLVQFKEKSFVYAYDREFDTYWKVGCSYIPASYPGTGDMFTSVLVGALLQGDSLPIALDRAVQFVSLAIRSTFGYGSPGREGVLFEKVLYSLMTPLAVSNYEVVE